MDAEIVRNRKFRIAVDLGNSNTAVAVYKDGMSTEVIPTIDDFPGEPSPNGTNKQVPSELLYPRRDAQPSGSITTDDIRIRFGHEVTQILTGCENPVVCKLYDQSGHISMMKLQLDQNDYASEAKKVVLSKLEDLKRLGHIKKNEDVLRDFLVLTLKHTKHRLIRDFGYEEGDTVEIIFSVPVCWKPTAITIMSKAVEDAAREVRLGTDGMSPCDLFVGHEAEMQSMHALNLRSSYTLQAGDVFILVDCGGGTMDMAMYCISQTSPLRLEAQVLEADGAMLGSNLLNEDFRAAMRYLLRHQDYLWVGSGNESSEEETSGHSLDSIIETELMPDFERKVKRAFESADSRTSYTFPLRGLRKDLLGDERIQKNRLVLNSNYISEVFQPTVRKIIKRVVAFATKARNERKFNVDKIVLTGGFGDSQYLRAQFIKMIDNLNVGWNTSIRHAFSPPNSSATGVVVGGILRSNDKADGPLRQPCQSIGILRHIPCDTVEFQKLPPEIQNQERKPNPDTKVDYIMNTIEWPIKKGQGTLESVHTVNFLSEFIFGPDELWIPGEKLFASEFCMEDFWQRTNDKIKGKFVKIGKVMFDISHLKEEIRDHNRRRRRRRDAVILLIQMKIIGRNLEFTARWPPTPQGQLIRGTRQYFSIAAAFPVSTE